VLQSLRFHERFHHVLNVRFIFSLTFFYIYGTYIHNYEFTVDKLEPTRLCPQTKILGTLFPEQLAIPRKLFSGLCAVDVCSIHFINYYIQMLSR